MSDEVQDIPTPETEEPKGVSLLDLLDEVKALDTDVTEAAPEPVADEPKAEPTAEPINSSSDAPATEELDEFEELAQQYGMAPDELKRFGSVESAQVFLELRDREFYQAGKQAWEQTQPQPTPQAVPPQTQPQQTPEPPSSEKVDWTELGFDDDVAKVLDQQHNTIAELNQRLQAVEYERYQASQSDYERQQAEVLGRYNTALEKLDPERYGVTGKETPTQKIARQANYENVAVLAAGLQSRGATGAFDPELMARRADLLTFQEENNKKAALATTAALKQRNARKLGAPGGGRQTTKTLDDHVPGKPLHEQPALLQGLAELMV